MEAKHVLSRGQGHHRRKRTPTQALAPSRSNKLNLQLTFICFIWRKTARTFAYFCGEFMIMLQAGSVLLDSLQMWQRLWINTPRVLPHSYMKLISAVGMKERGDGASARSSSLKARLSWKHMVLNWAHFCATSNIRSNKENRITCHLCKHLSDLRLQSKTKILAVLFCPPSFVPSVWLCHVWFRMCCC